MRIFFALSYFFLSIISISSAQVRPDNFIPRTEVDSSNTEFYSQKDGVRRRVNLWAIRNFVYRSDTAFVNNDTLYLSNVSEGVYLGAISGYPDSSPSLLDFTSVNELLSVSADTGDVLKVHGFDESQRSGFYRYEVNSSVPAGAAVDSLSVIPLLNGNYAILRPQNNTLLASNFGLNESNTDNGPPCRKMYSYAKLNGYSMLFDVPGNYRFETVPFDDNGNASWDIHIEAVDGVVLEQYTKSALFFKLKNKNIGGDYSLLGGQNRGQTQLKFVSTDGLGPSDIITIESSSVVTGLGFKKSDVVEIDYVLNDSIVILKDSLLFEYADGEAMSFIRVHKYHTLTIKNIDIRQLYDNESTVGGAAGLFWGFNDVVFEDITLKADTLFESSVNDGFLLTNCANVKASRLRFEGMRYGWLVNYGLNYTVRDAVIEHSRHLIATSTWSRNMYIDGVYSYKCGSPVEAHYGWNYTFRNFRGDQEGDLNIRAFGVIRLEDCYIRAGDCPSCSTYSLIGYHFARGTLDSTFMYLVDNTHIRISNVIYEEEGPYGQFKGLTACSYQTLTVENCVAANIGGYENSNQADGVQVLISNCILGRSYLNNCGDDNIVFDNCTFDRSRFPGEFVTSNGEQWLISADAGTTVNFNNCEFYDTDSVNLVNYWVLSGLRLRFDNCYGANFKDWATQYNYAHNMPYDNLITLIATDVRFLQSSVMDSVLNYPGTSYTYSVDFSGSIDLLAESEMAFSDQTIETLYKDDREDTYWFPMTGTNDVGISTFTSTASGLEVNGISFQRTSDPALNNMLSWIGGQGGNDLEVRSFDKLSMYSSNSLMLEFRNSSSSYQMPKLMDAANLVTNPLQLVSLDNSGFVRRFKINDLSDASTGIGIKYVLLGANSGTGNERISVDNLFNGRTLSGETTISGSLVETNKRTVSSASDTLTSTDYIAYVDASSNSVDIYLPDAATVDGSVFIIQAIDAANAITIVPLGGNINGSASIALSAAFDYYEIHCHNGNYYARQ